MTEDAARTSNGKGVTLSPDPTILTRDAISRELTALREILGAEIAGNLAVLTARLDGNEKAVILLQAAHDKLPTQMDDRVGHMTNLFNERFNTVGEQFEGVKLQFSERDTRVKDAKAAGDDALKAALAAQKEQAGDQVKSLKESIDKSEAATTKQIDTQGASINTATQALERRIADLKERIDRGEGQGVGRSGAFTDQRANLAALVGVIGIVVLVLGYLATH